MARILLIEDEVNTLRFLVDALKRQHEVTTKTTAAEALAELREHQSAYDLVVLDLMLPPGIAEDARDQIPRLSPEDVGKYIFDTVQTLGDKLPTIILTGFYADLNGFRSAVNVELMMKPITVAELCSKIDGLLQQAKATKEST